MEHSDAVFLVEIEEFLTSSDLPTLVSSPASNEAGNRLLCAGSKGDEANAQEGEGDRTDNSGKSYYKRRKMTHKRLQDQVVELTKKLNSAVQAKQTSAKQSSSKWMALANYQHQQRIQAETRNHQLRAAVDTRSKLIDDFRTLLADRLKNVNSDMHLVESCLYKRLVFEQTNIAILSQYMLELDTIYSQLDETRYAEDLDSVGEDMRSYVRTWKEDGSGRFLYVNKQNIPFNFQQTCKSLWRVENLPDWRGGQEPFAGVSDPENTMAVKFRIGSGLESDLTVLQRVVVVRRYQERDRMVIIWRSFAEGQGLYAGMHADETGWSVVTPLKGEPKAETRSRSSLKTCIRHIPMHLNGANNQHPVARRFTSLVLDTRANESSKFLLALEKFLREA
ncbi:hypothetical protein PHMEG_00031838 [Phytophthora megakarya]|uniref:M96 mating-specific protein n=1 Tax=Phytophthora megakarya TaxID=4795 RepID=A0A225UVX3_9STRA|nr:hypothetical protein PHMEG_00031838 [Phytophthora megakarya]